MITDPLVKHNILLYEGDFDVLKELHPAQSPTSVVRQLVRAHILRLQAVRAPETEQLKGFV